MKPNENFSRLTVQQLREIIEEYASKQNLPTELLVFNYKKASEILCISERSLKELKMLNEISYSQKKARSRVTFTANDLIDYLNSTKNPRK